MLRIAAGAWKGQTLAAPRTLRATEAKVRQAFFNIMGQAVDGARMLDGFAGSGAMGLEALSRGAAFAAFIESDTEAVLCLRDNLERFGLALPRGAWRVLHLDIERGLRELSGAEPPFDIVFFDPPYRSDDGKKALNALDECAILAPTGIAAIEHHHRTELPASVGTLQQWKRHRYGDTVLSFYRVP